MNFIVWSRWNGCRPKNQPLKFGHSTAVYFTKIWGGRPVPFLYANRVPFNVWFSSMNSITWLGTYKSTTKIWSLRVFYQDMRWQTSSIAIANRVLFNPGISSMNSMRWWFLQSPPGQYSILSLRIHFLPQCLCLSLNCFAEALFYDQHDY